MAYHVVELMRVAIGATLEHVPNGWRWMVGLGALPGILQLSTLHLLPESREPISTSYSSIKLIDQLAFLFSAANTNELMPSWLGYIHHLPPRSSPRR
jgi:hypothetical protein